MPKEENRTLALALALGWFLLNDFSDNSWAQCRSSREDGMAIVRNLTIASSILIPIALFELAEG